MDINHQLKNVRMRQASLSILTRANSSDGWVPACTVYTPTARKRDAARASAHRLRKRGFADLETRTPSFGGRQRIHVRITPLGKAALFFHRRQRERNSEVRWNKFAAAAQLVGLAA